MDDPISTLLHYITEIWVMQCVDHCDTINTRASDEAYNGEQIYFSKHVGLQVKSFHFYEQQHFINLPENVIQIQCEGKLTALA